MDTISRIRSSVFLDDDLEQFAASADNRTSQSVIIEVDAGKVKLGAASSQTSGFQPNWTHVAPAIDPTLALKSVQQQLYSLQVAEEPVVLGDGKMLVATLTPEQLRNVSEMPEVARIRPNRTHIV